MLREQVKELKARYKITYKAISAGAGVNYKTLRNWLCGYHNNLSIENEQKLREYIRFYTLRK